MGYLFLSLATLCGLTKGFCGKKVSGLVKKSRDAMLANLLRMMLCIFIGFLFVVFIDGFSSFNIGPLGILISTVSGISNAVFVVAWLFAVNAGAYMLVDVFLTLGLVIPITLSTVFFGEELRWNHFLGFAVLTVAVVIMCSYSSSVKNKLNFKSVSLLMISGAAQGIASFTQKWFVHSLSEKSVSSFNFYTYIFSALTLAVAIFIINAKNKKEEISESEENGFFLKKIWLFVVIMALMLFLHSFLMTLAAAKLDAVLLYPLSTGLSLALSAIMSSIAFKEKLTSKCIIGIIIAFSAMIIINVL